MADITKHDALTGSANLSSGDSHPSKEGGAGPKAIIKNVDMSEEMQQESVDIASAALEKYNIEKDIAAQIKREFDRKFGPTWHVVVGKNFGSYVTHGELLLVELLWRSSSVSPFTPFSMIGLISLLMHRNKTFHLLLHRLARDPHLEVLSL
jgi:dynein light chain LC8-type